MRREPPSCSAGFAGGRRRSGPWLAGLAAAALLAAGPTALAAGGPAARADEFRRGEGRDPAGPRTEERIALRFAPPDGVAGWREALAARRLAARLDPTAGGGAFVVVESSELAFGEVTPTEPVELPAALIVRVFSPTGWELEILPGPVLENADRGEAVPISRLGWRSALSGSSFRPLASGRPETIARGGPTGAGGQLVQLALRLELEPGDPLGAYRAALRLRFETR